MNPGVPPSHIRQAVSSGGWAGAADEDECLAVGHASDKVAQAGNDGSLLDPEGGSKSSCSSLWWSMVVRHCEPCVE